MGPHASGIGSLDGEATVTFSPSGAPLELEVTGSGSGVWEASNSGGAMPEGSAHGGASPESGGGAGESGGNTSSGSGGEAGKSEPLLSLSHEGGDGVGSKFVGALDLTSDPTAQAALVQVLAGNTDAGIPVLVSEMNDHGTEYTQSYHLTKSSSTYGIDISAGGGGGGELNDGSSSACYDAPRVRHDGGPWTSSTAWSGPPC